MTRSLRTDLYLLDESLGRVLGNEKEGKGLLADKASTTALKKSKGDLDAITKYIPLWVKVMVALALGCGTMIGWKRIVVTVGEKIGKSHLTYAQGASAEFMPHPPSDWPISWGFPSAPPTSFPRASRAPWRPTGPVSRRRP